MTRASTIYPVLLALLLICLLPVRVEAGMVSSNILQRVFCIRVGSQQATAFTIEVDNRQYLITAQHVVSSKPSSIEILHDKNWVTVPITIIPVDPESVDIAVIALKQKIASLLPVELGMKDTFLSQEVYFVGFPYGLYIDGRAMNSGFPLPLVKRGIIAALGLGKGAPFLIDAINNPGFSGGPVIQANNPKKPKIIGVISGFRAAQQSVLKEKKETEDLTILVNTGLVVAYEIDNAISAIEKNPIGWPIRSSD